MADSENSRTVPTITRRKLTGSAGGASSGDRWIFSDASRRNFLAGVAASIAATLASEDGRRAGEANGGADLVVLLWRDWLTAYRLRSEACRRQQKLETELLREFGSFPRTAILLGDDVGFLWAYSESEIDRLLPNPDQVEARRTAKADLLERRNEWQVADERIGYSKAEAIEEELAGVEDGLAKDLWNASSRSVAGVAAKLHAVLETEDPGSGLAEAPWPELRKILIELVQLREEPRSM